MEAIRRADQLRGDPEPALGAPYGAFKHMGNAQRRGDLRDVVIAAAIGE